MLRREIEGGWFLVHQREHAVLAYTIMKYWADEPFYRPDYYDEVLFAIREHDSGWECWDRHPRINENRHPRSFMEMETEEKVKIWASCYSRWLDDHPYAAALIAIHFYLFNERILAREPGNPHALGLRNEVARLVEEVLNVRLTEVGRGRLPRPFDFDLRLLQIGDALSLTVCHGWRSCKMDPVPCADGYGPCRVEMVAAGEHAYVVEGPYPFTESELHLKVRGVRLERRCFDDDLDLRRAVEAAPRETMDVVIRRA